MSELALNTRSLADDLSGKAFDLSVRAWFVLAALGHWIFLIYIVGMYFPPLAQQGLSGMQGTAMPGGFREGELLGNLAAASHVLLATIVIGGGPLQLIPAVRARYPLFHRVLGRSYLVAAVISALGGLYMLWTRGTVGGPLNHVAISGDAVLILVFATFALRHAMARQIAVHRRWALRLFMAASAVWFFRVGLMSWFMLTGGVGIDPQTFTGPFLIVMAFAQYLLPLAVLEWYFRCQDRARGAERLAFAGVLSGLTVLMGVGIFGATMGMWLPRL